MTTLVAEKRLYETPEGELVEEVEDSGSLFCGVGAELTGEDAKRYVAYFGAAPKAEPGDDETPKEAVKPVNKAAPKPADKGA